jgi:hypothetical protein
MTSLTEGRHAAEFILSEANHLRSRENGVLVTGQNLAAGTVVQLAAGKLTAFTAAVDTDGDLLVQAEGILLDNVDATDGDVPCAYIARDAEVNLNRLVYPAESSEGGEQANTVASLKLLGIIAR